MNERGLLPDDALIVGNPEELVKRSPGVAETAVQWPKSDGPRGLTVRRLTITNDWDKVLWMFRTRNEIFYTSLAFDMSGEEPVLFPPKSLDAATHVFKMDKGETIQFTLGEGEPIFPARVLQGGLCLFIMLWESDKNPQELGALISKVHDDLKSDGSVMDKIKALIKNPGDTITDEILSVATSALQPLATVLKENDHDFIAPFRGYYEAKGSWQGKLAATRAGVEIELRELNGGG